MPQTAPARDGETAGWKPTSKLAKLADLLRPKLADLLTSKLPDLLRSLAEFLEHRGGPRVVRPTLPQAFRDLVRRIESFAGLPERWNGNSGGPVPKDVRQEAIAFLGKLDANYGASLLAPTALNATSDRGVLMEWRLADSKQKIAIIFMPGGANEYTVRNLVTDTLEYGDENVRESSLLDLVKSSVVNRARSLPRSTAPAAPR